MRFARIERAKRLLSDPIAVLRCIVPTNMVKRSYRHRPLRSIILLRHLIGTPGK